MEKKQQYYIFSKKFKILVLFIITLGFIGLFLQFAFPETKPKIINSVPQEKYYIYQDFLMTFIFEKNITETQKNKISVKTTPKFETSFFWTDTDFTNNNLPTLNIKSIKNLKTNTDYLIQIFYDKKIIYERKFKTQEYTDEEIRSQAIEQISEDLYFNEQLDKARLDRPWMDKLPIIKDKYTIVFDSDKNSFRIRLKLPLNSSDFEIETAKLEAIEDLKKAGVDLTVWNYHFL